MIEYVRKQARLNQERIDRAGMTTSRESSRQDGGLENRRAVTRFEVTAKARLTVFLGSVRGEKGEGQIARLVRSGFTRDLSMSGACVLLDRQLEPVPYRQLVGRDVRLNLELPGDHTASLHVLGRVAWGAEQQDKVALGIEFTDISVEERRVLERCCREDDGEVKRILNLWQLLVAEDGE